MHEDSCIDINYAHMFSKCFRSLHTMLGFALYFVSSIQLLSLYPFIQFWPVREFLVEIHTAKTGLLRCCLDTHRRLQWWIAIDCKRNQLSQKKEKSWKSHVWGLIQRRQTTSFSVLSFRFVRRSCADFHLNYYELHQESLHCHQLEEELDDWCQYWYFQNGMGLSCRSPDSWCRRFNVDNASLMSERFLNGSVFPRLIKRDPPILFVSKIFFLRHVMEEILLRKLVHFDTDLFISIMFELGCTKFGIDQKAIVDPLISVAMRSSLLNDIIWNWEKVQCTYGASGGFTVFQEMPAGAIDDA